MAPCIRVALQQAFNWCTKIKGRESGSLIFTWEKEVMKISYKAIHHKFGRSIQLNGSSINARYIVRPFTRSKS